MRFVFAGLFFLVASTILYFAHRYLWIRMVRDSELRGRTRTLATAVIVGLGGVVVLTLAIARRLPREYVEWLAIGSFLWLGALLYLILLLAPWELVRRKTSPDRRKFLARAAAGTAILGTGGIVIRGAGNALGEITTPTIEVPLARLPRALDGFTIAQLTDVHIGPILDGRFLDGVVEQANALKPDLVVITGDLVDGTPALIGPDVARLSRLRSRYGTYFVTGNHEYYSGAGPWVEFLRKHGIRTLTNERIVIGEPTASFDLCGVPDKRGGAYRPSHVPDMQRALQGRDPDRELVLLAHRPGPIHEAAQRGVGLQLSGHTHGGQLWPITEATRLVHPYTDGLSLHDEKTWIYVSRGTGFWGPPMRIAAPAEITKIVLTAA